MAIDIIEASPGMNDEICSLLIHSISESCAKDHHNDPNILEPWLENKTPDIVRTWLEINRTYCAINSAGKIVGVLQANSENRILLNYVDPDLSGKGIGSKLLRKLETEIGDGETVLVDSTKTAKPFYLKKGFVEAQDQSNELSKQISL